MNFVGAVHAEVMNATAASVPHGVDEFVLAGVAPAPCRIVKAPRVAGAIAAMECRLAQIVRLKNADGVDVDGWMAIGEVVGVHIDEAYLIHGIFDTAAARPIARCGYRGDYTEVNAIFEMIRPA